MESLGWKINEYANVTHYGQSTFHLPLVIKWLAKIGSRSVRVSERQYTITHQITHDMLGLLDFYTRVSNALRGNYINSFPPIDGPLVLANCNDKVFWLCIQESLIRTHNEPMQEPLMRTYDECLSEQLEF